MTHSIYSWVDVKSDSIGERCEHLAVKSDAFIWDSTRIADEGAIGPNAMFMKDLMLRPKKYSELFKGVTVGNGASIGANGTFWPGLVVGKTL